MTVRGRGGERGVVQVEERYVAGVVGLAPQVEHGGCGGRGGGEEAVVLPAARAAVFLSARAMARDLAEFTSGASAAAIWSWRHAAALGNLGQQVWRDEKRSSSGGKRKRLRFPRGGGRLRRGTWKHAREVVEELALGDGALVAFPVE